METRVLTIDSEKIDPSKIDEAAALIDSGGLVAFPTETVYGIACRVKSDSLARLDDIKGVPRFAKNGETETQGRTSGKYYTLHIGQKIDIANYVPTIGLKSQKLIRKAWPGPLTIVFELDEEDLDKQRKNLEAEVFQGLYYRCSGLGTRDSSHERQATSGEIIGAVTGWHRVTAVPRSCTRAGSGHSGRCVPSTSGVSRRVRRGR